MLPRIKDISIKHKLMLINLVTTLVAVTLATAAILCLEILTYRQKMVEDLSTLAQIIGANSSAALLFNDEKAAEETLSALTSEPNIQHADLLLREGRPLVTFSPPGAMPKVAFDTSGANGTRHIFYDNALALVQPIAMNGERIGSVFLQSDLRQFKNRQRMYIFASGTVLFLAVLVGVLMTAWFQRIISRPILDLVAKMGRVGTDKQYSIRPRRRAPMKSERLSMVSTTCCPRSRNGTSSSKATANSSKTRSASAPKSCWLPMSAFPRWWKICNAPRRPRNRATRPSPSSWPT
jgi:hypothetical protein